MKTSEFYVWVPGYDDINPHYGLLVTFGSLDEAAQFFSDADTILQEINDLFSQAGRDVNETYPALRLLINGQEPGLGIRVYANCAATLVEDQRDVLGRKADVFSAVDIERAAPRELFTNTWTPTYKPSQHFYLGDEMGCDGLTMGVDDPSGVLARMHFRCSPEDVAYVSEKLSGLRQPKDEELPSPQM